MSLRPWVPGLLFALVMSSALGVVYTRHQSRVLFMGLQQALERRDALNVEWGRLQLEQSTWATHGRIEREARERLDMRMPDARSTVILLE
ncbi:cell division protein FtsL [Ectothiorhodospira mobilis]|uniref:cell division protein FtsL n=1 Tax=Ectothiorhodospira mobilis TaxID=195064 RepID=UPI001903FBF2|nr:cell division protein FtsL [Ectothiorhodospira mobilis]MBK1692710.1 cell division protein FtsL [Ectothiorhodospira mobilis]